MKAWSDVHVVTIVGAGNFSNNTGWGRLNIRFNQ